MNCNPLCLPETQITTLTPENRLNAVSNKLSLFHLSSHVHRDYFQIGQRVKKLMPIFKYWETFDQH